MAIASVPRETAPDVAGQTIHQLPLDLITVGPNVRVNVDRIDELAESIREHGVIQPIKVRHAEDGAGYVVTWGQRRLLASRIAERTEIPAILDDTEQTEAERAIEQLVENLAREDLPALDRARAMRAVVDAGISQADLARELGLHPSTVANDLGLLESPAKVRTLVEQGAITPAHAKALKGLAPSTQAELATRVARDGLSAHATEDLVQQHKRSEQWRKEREAAEREETRERSAKLAESIGRIEKRIPKGEPVRIQAWYNESRVNELAKLLKSAGYTDVEVGTKGIVGTQRESLGCDCHAWQLEIASYAGTVTIRQACIVQAHRAAKAKADRDEYERRSDLDARVRARLAEVLVDQVAQLPPLAARLALWEQLGWQADKWARDMDARLIVALDESKPKRKKRNAWATLFELDIRTVHLELAKKLAFPTRQGDHEPDYAALAAELGIEAPAK